MCSLLLPPRHYTQVGNLSCLRSLTLGCCDDVHDQGSDVAHPTGGLSMLHALQHLKAYDYYDMDWLPAVALHLSSLQVLDISHKEVGERPDRHIAALVDSSLRALPQLRGPWLDVGFDGPSFPAAATALSSLQWLYLDRDGDFGLPAGPWQHSLRRVVLSPVVATASTAFLQGSPKLEHVTLRWSLYAGMAERTKHR